MRMADALVKVRIACLAREMAEGAITHAVIEARLAGGTWDDIGWALGVSKQAAAQRFGPLVEAMTA